jgi:hypothetical protein
MHAVVVRSTLHDFDKATRFLREQAIPRVSQAPGFVGAQWVRVGEHAGTSTVIFESEENANAAVEQMRANPPPADALTMDTVEVGEVVERI